MPLKHLLPTLLLLLPLGATAQRAPWADDPHEPAASRQQAVRALRHYRPVAVRLSELRAALRAAPAEESAAAGVVLALPRPEGGTERFRVRQVAVMAPALAARFPQLKTYRAESLDTPGAVAWLDVSPRGWHAQVLTPGRPAYYLDPAAAGDTLHHRVFYKTDQLAGAGGWHCEVAGGVGSQGKAAATGRLLTAAAGGGARQQAAGGGPVVRRTLQLAVACTPEYALVKGNTVAGALAAIVSTVNRVNGVYERELAVRLELVPNNDRLVFLSGTGPQPNPAYTNANGDALLTENQQNVDRVIGSANYDVGHVFGTGGAGIAYTPAACDSQYKAQGVSGVVDPSGDAFDIDYVAHEIGHQLGAHHTFNSTRELCGGGNRYAETAYEPGSGTSIMAYAGICAPENVQLHSDPYFHSASYDEIRAYLDGPASCGQRLTTANRAPVPVAGVGRFIPKSTPFVLTGAATDPDGNALTYSWEELDLGPDGPLSSPSGEAPLFRVLPPVASPTRYFPQLDELTANTQLPGEQLPTYGRRLRFRLAARDNRAGGGGLAYDSLSLAVIEAAGPFVVRAPNTAAERWQAGAPAPVSWDVAGTTAAPISAATVDILFSADGGATYPIVLAAATPNDGAETLTLPANLPATARARVMVRATGNVFFDISDADFTVQQALGTQAPTPLASLSVAPNPSRGAFTVSLTNEQRGALRLRVLDVLGRELRTETARKSADSWSYPLDLGGLSAGVYLLQLTLPDGQRAVRRLVRD